MASKSMKVSEILYLIWIAFIYDDKNHC